MVETRNIEFCAYLRLKGYNIAELNIISRGKASYLVEIAENEFRAHKIIFEQSDFKKFYDLVNSTKELAY